MSRRRSRAVFIAQDLVALICWLAAFAGLALMLVGITPDAG